jgi:hypothetical protein
MNQTNPVREMEAAKSHDFRHLKTAKGPRKFYARTHARTHARKAMCCSLLPSGEGARRADEGQTKWLAVNHHANSTSTKPASENVLTFVAPHPNPSPVGRGALHPSPFGRRCPEGADEGTPKQQYLYFPFASTSGCGCITASTKLSNSAAPSSGAARHLLPEGEGKKSTAEADARNHAVIGFFVLFN